MSIQCIRRVEADGVTLVEQVYRGAAAMAAHAHEDAFFTAVLAGSCEETRRSRSQELRAGMVRFHAAGDSHAVAFGAAGARIVRMELAPRLLADVLPYAPALRSSGVLAGRPPLGAIDSDLAISAVLFEWIGALSRGKLSRTPPRWVARAAEVVDARFAESLSLRDVAASVGVHPVTLAREFRGHYGVSVGERLRSVRIRAAAQLLTGSRRSISDIALATGFADQSHLTRTFARVMGQPPGKFRAGALLSSAAEFRG